jgi:hypothetical protein
MDGDIYIHIDANGIGDRIQWSSLPEAFYKWYGRKLIDVNRSWVFDNNPFVQRRDDSLNRKIKITDIELACLYCDKIDWVNPNQEGMNFVSPNADAHKLLVFDLFPSYLDHNITSSRNFWLFERLGIYPNQKPELDIPRGPRLYKYEEPNNVKRDQITIHVGPSRSTKQYIPDYVMEKIKERYSGYKIIQIGSPTDNRSPFIRKTGLNIWESIKTISQSSIFIGINSGPMNIANCFPHISKKVIINSNIEWQKQETERFEPLGAKIVGNFGWVDFGWQYYTVENHDVGRMYSYKRI